MVTLPELLESVERLREALLVHAHESHYADDVEYRSLRRALLMDSRTRDHMPEFVRTCRNLQDFWMYVKDSPYDMRQEIVRTGFEPILSKLEMEVFGYTPDSVLAVPTNVTSNYVRDAWHKAIDRKARDPEGAITAARTLLETVCKHILDDIGTTYGDKDDLPKLYSLVAAEINLAPSQHEEKVFKQILGGCQAVAEGLGSLRNRLGDAHGKGRIQARPLPRHAELAVNLAGAMATFLMATWEARQQAQKSAS